MNDADRTRFRHMLEAARKVQAFMAGHTHADLGQNRLLALAVLIEDALSRSSRCARR
jgi:uncharacterized protein with HEPN domain